MPRAADVMVVITYALVAIVAALAFERFGLMGSELAWLMGAVVFLIAGQAHGAAARAEERRLFRDEIDQLKSSNLSMLEELEAAQERIDALTEQGALEAPSGAPVTPAAATPPSANAPRPEDRLISELLARLESAGATSASRPAQTEAVSAALIREALDANRVDLYLQPVVGLPQRRTYFYEGFSRLRDADGEVITPAAFLSAAEEAGLIGEVDNLLLFRCVQIVRRLTRSDRRTGVFCNISLRSFADERFFPDFLEFMRTNSDLAGSLIFEVPQAAFLERSATAARNMARLADYGFRFSIDQIEDLNIDLAEMQRAGVRFAKIEAGRLIQAAHGAEGIAGREPGAIRAEDIAGLFARHGVDLVAEKIETEPTVVEVLDLDVAYAQGYLFGAPRPVREEVIAEAGAPERKAG